MEDAAASVGLDGKVRAFMSLTPSCGGDLVAAAGHRANGRRRGLRDAVAGSTSPHSDLG